MKGRELKLTEVNMTALTISGLILLFIIVPYLTGNVYGFVFRKKEMGIVSTYLAGMAVIYALLTMVQLVVIKFKFNFNEVTRIYNIVFIVCIVLGVLGLVMRLVKQKAIHWDIQLSKKSLWIFGMILLQGILYIGFKTPYFEDNALLETARVTLDTGSVYEYNAFTGMKVKAGFPLSNKLMFLPMLYAYVSAFSGMDLAIMFNFVMPTVTFLSFYLLMVLWVQKLSKESGKKWELWLFLIVWIVQVSGGFNHSTVFRVLHSGYTGEAIFFGVLFLYMLYSIKNKSYLIAAISAVTFPGLIKYDLLIEFVKGFDEYWRMSALGGGMLLVYILSVIYIVIKNRKGNIELLNVNLTISNGVMTVWENIVTGENKIIKKIFRGGLILLVLLMCGNIMIISDATSWRSNMYGITKADYEILQMLDEDGKTGKRVVACEELVKWVKRMGVEVEPVIGYDLGSQNVGWYSYENYDENHTKLWQSVNHATANMEYELETLAEEIDMDYIVVKRITEFIPITKNERIKCVYDNPDYIVYFVDKK